MAYNNIKNHKNQRFALSLETLLTFLIFFIGHKALYLYKKQIFDICFCINIKLYV